MFNHILKAARGLQPTTTDIPGARPPKSQVESLSVHFTMKPDTVGVFAQARQRRHRQQRQAAFVRSHRPHSEVRQHRQAVMAAMLALGRREAMLKAVRRSEEALQHAHRTSRSTTELSSRPCARANGPSSARTRP